jgi:hypoxanthine phosphoribosyltransferase
MKPIRGTSNSPVLPPSTRAPRVISSSTKRISRQGATRPAVPRRWRAELARILISRQQIARRVKQLSRQIESDFAGCDLVIVAVLSGTVMFLADLMRHLSLPMRVDFVGTSSYRDGTVSGELIFTKLLKLEVRGRHVLLVDDILDTGRTLSRVMAKLRQLQPRCVKTCVLLEKASRRLEPVQADYVGFSIPDLFVVGYGLDFAERYRNLPFIGVLRPECCVIGSGQKSGEVQGG